MYWRASATDWMKSDCLMVAMVTINFSRLKYGCRVDCSNELVFRRKMEQGIRFKLIWEDNDLLEIVLSAWNGEFGGIAKIYVGHGELVEMAKSLHGFPQTNPDDRKFDLGDLNPNGLGGAAVRFYTKNMAGHAAVEI